jgi:hypothetical protein
MLTWPSPKSERLGTPDLPQSVSRGACNVGASWFTHLLRPVSLLAPLYGSDWVSPATGDFYVQAFNGSVTLTVAGYHYNSNWTSLLAGLSPARMAASFAAADLGMQHAKQRIIVDINRDHRMAEKAR